MRGTKLAQETDLTAKFISAGSSSFQHPRSKIKGDYEGKRRRNIKRELLGSLWFSLFILVLVKVKKIP